MAYLTPACVQANAVITQQPPQVDKAINFLAIEQKFEQGKVGQKLMTNTGSFLMTLVICPRL
jgi:hypothetical protein